MTFSEQQEREIKNIVSRQARDQETELLGKLIKSSDGFRGYLEQQLRHAKWFIATILIVLFSVASFLGIKTLPDVAETAAAAAADDAVREEMLDRGMQSAIDNAVEQARIELTQRVETIMRKSEAELAKKVAATITSQLGTNAAARIEAAAETQIRAFQAGGTMETAIRHSLLPVGSIVALYGGEDALPEGWAVCDGTNGAPDLRGRFLRGGDFSNVRETGGSVAGTTTSAEYPGYRTETVGLVNTNGGSLNMTKPSHSHQLTLLPPFASVIYIIRL